MTLPVFAMTPLARLLATRCLLLRGGSAHCPCRTAIQIIFHHAGYLSSIREQFIDFDHNRGLRFFIPIRQNLYCLVSLLVTHTTLPAVEVEFSFWIFLRNDGFYSEKMDFDICCHFSQSSMKMSK